MKKVILIILAVVLILAVGLDWPDPSVTVDGMKIQGPEQFREDVLEGLDLLREKAPKYYVIVVENVKKVYLSDSDFNGWYKDGSFGFNQGAYGNIIANREYKAYYIALTLVHEGYHLQRYNEGKFTDNVEKEEWLAVQAEKDVARLIDVPQAIKDWLDGKFDTRWWE